MSTLVSRLVPDSFIYGLGGAANQTVAILLVPIYARQLGPSGVGISAVVNTTVALSLILVGLALPQAFLRWFLTENPGDRPQLEILGETMGLRLLTSFLGALAVGVVVVPLTQILYGDLANLPIFAAIPVIVFFDSLITIPLSYLRALRRARDYSLLSFTRAAFGTVLIVYFVVGANLGVFGIVLGSAISATVCALIGVGVVRRAGVRWKLDGPLSRAMLAFSLPLVPAAAAGWVLNLADRYLLQVFTDADIVGVYALGYVGGMVVLAFVVQPFALAWGATAWEIATEEDAPTQYARVLTGFTVVAAFAALGITALATDALRLLVGADFAASRFVVLFSAFAYVLYGVNSVVTVGLYISARTRWVSVAVGAAALVSLTLNLALIPLLGMFGAALATLVSYGSLPLLTARFARRYYPVKWDTIRVCGALGLAIILSTGALLGPDSLIWRVATIAIYVPVLLILRIVSTSDIRAILALVRRGPLAN